MGAEALFQEVTSEIVWNGYAITKDFLIENLDSSYLENLEEYDMDKMVNEINNLKEKDLENRDRFKARVKKIFKEVELNSMLRELENIIGELREGKWSKYEEFEDIYHEIALFIETNSSLVNNLPVKNRNKK